MAMNFKNLVATSAVGESAQTYVFDPHIKGYVFAFFTLPSKIFGSGGSLGSSSSGDTDPRFRDKLTISYDQSTNTYDDADQAYRERVLAQNFVSITLPEITLQEAEAQGIGGLKTVHPTAISTTNAFSMTFREQYEAPVVRMLEEWQRTIRDWITGVMTISQRQKFYKGTIDIVITTPAIEFVYGLKFYGCWPTNVQLEALGGNRTENAIAEVTVNWKFDKIDNLSESDAQSLLSELESMNPSTTTSTE